MPVSAVPFARVPPPQAMKNRPVPHHPSLDREVDVAIVLPSADFAVMPGSTDDPSAYRDVWITRLSWAGHSALGTRHLRAIDAGFIDTLAHQNGILSPHKEW